MATNDVFWDSVVSIEPLGVEEVYDATVLGTHNFVAERHRRPQLASSRMPTW